jgi:uncharacterized ubiquitin-like protein YukD
MDGVCESGRRSMLAISIVSIILVATAIFYSLCRISSRTYGNINYKSIVFVHRDDRKYFGDLFLNGDMEGIYRMMQILQQRELLEIIEMGEEIYLVNHNPASIENIRTVPRGLFVSDYHPVEDLRALRAATNSFRHVSLEEGCMTVRKPLKVFKAEEITNDLFMSDFDVLEILKHLSPQAPFFSTSKA